MSNKHNSPYNKLFSSLVSDIKSYNGSDPLLPWLRGIKKMKETVPPQLLKEKLPRFLQKCAETFLTDRRYTNDLRYVRVWLQLMDFVDDPKGVLKMMEFNRIGTKKTLFYQAYALYYEKKRKFEAAEKIYHLGVKNLAEPADELQKSYDQLLNRMERHKNKRIQREGRKTNGAPQFNETFQPKIQAKCVNTENKSNPSRYYEIEIPTKEADHNRAQSSRYISEDTMYKFVDTAIVGKSNTEDARHHGLVEPTINTKEAINAINSMFQEPLEPPIASKKIVTNKPKTGNALNNGINIFTDENVEKNSGKQPMDEPFEIYVDGEKTNDFQAKKSRDISLPVEFSKVSNPKRFHHELLREDTVVRRFVGSTILDESKVENALHHGLVDPTINLKEAMNDINNMFGKSIEFSRKRRPKKQDKATDAKDNFQPFMILPDDELDIEKEKNHLSSGFLILPDDNMENQQYGSLPGASVDKESDLFEQTVCTKEARDEINKLFAMPMDF